MALWHRFGLLCVVLATAGIAIANGDALVTQLHDAPVVTMSEKARTANPNPQDDRHYGEVEERMSRGVTEEEEEGNVDREYQNPKSAKIATKWDDAMKAETKTQAMSDKELNFEATNAVMQAAVTTENIGAIPLDHVGPEELNDLQRVADNVKRANEDLSQTEREKAYMEKLEKGLSGQEAPAQAGSAPDAKQAPPATPFTDLFKQSQKLAGQMESYAKEAKATDARFAHIAQKEAEVATKACDVDDTECRKNRKRAQEDQQAIDKQHAFDVNPTASLDESPSYQGVVEAEEKDQEMQQHIEDETKQLQTLKKTGQLKPLPKHKPKPVNKLELAKEWEKESAAHSKEDASLEKGYAAYEARFNDGQRSDFRDEHPVKFVSSPAAEALYQKLKAKQHKDLSVEIAKLKKVELQEKNEHMQTLKEAMDESPTKKTVAELVKEGAAGALRLQQEMAMQEKIEERNAKDKSGKPPMTLEEELKKHKLKQVSQWQAATLLKEGEDAVVSAAEELETSGSKADLAVLRANEKRLILGKPALSKSEINQTKAAANEQDRIKHDLGTGQEYEHYKMALNASEERMARSTKAIVAGATSDSEVTAYMDYSGDDDELLPDSEKDPMLRTSIDYGHAYDANSYNPGDYDDDDRELEALDIPMTSVMNGNTEAKEEDQENEKNMSEEALTKEYSQDQEAALATDAKQTFHEGNDVDSTP